MKALSIRQPWAFAIVTGFKDIENRTWHTRYRGPLLIHASLKEETDQVADVLTEIAMARWEAAGRTGAGWDYGRSTADAYKAMKGLGRLVGRIDMTDCVRDHASDWFHGPHGFVLEGAQICQLYPYRGRQGLFDVPDDVAAGLDFPSTWEWPA